MKRFPRSTEVQSLLFDKSAFNVTRAKEWAKAHGYRTSGTDIGGDRATKIRLRQADPKDFTQTTFRTIEFGHGIEAIIAMPKEAPAARRNPAAGFPPIRAGESSVSYGVRYATAQTGYAGQAAAYAAGVAKGNAWHKAYYAAIDHHRALTSAPETGPHTPTLRRIEAHPSWDAELSGRDAMLHPSFYKPRKNPSTSLGSYGEIRTKKPLNAAAKRVVQSFIAGDNSYSDLHAYLTEHGFGPEALHSPAQIAEARKGVRAPRKNPMTASAALKLAEDRVSGMKLKTGYTARVILQPKIQSFSVRTIEPHPTAGAKGYHVADGVWHAGVGRFYITGSGGAQIQRALGDLAYGAAELMGAAPLRKNPMTADLASMDFDEFAKHVVIGKGYNTLSGRRFARVHSRDNAVVTDVPISDGDGGSPLKRAIDIKHRAYDQLRVHLVPGQTLADRKLPRRNPAMPDYDVAYKDAKGRMVREAVRTKTQPPRGSWGTSVYITESGVRVPESKAVLIGPLRR